MNAKADWLTSEVSAHPSWLSYKASAQSRKIAAPATASLQEESGIEFAKLRIHAAEDSSEA